MGTSEENYERMWQMRQENEQRREELEQQRREREYLREMGQAPPERREWRLPEAEPPPRERRRDTSPVNSSAEIDQRIANERRFLIEVVGQAVGELREQIETNMRKEFEAELKRLSVQLCDVKIRCAELRISNTELREQLSGHVTDLPALPLRSRAN
jgi:hypothetical protein